MSITRHTFYNLSGSMAQIAIGIIIVPVYLHLIGPVRYGVLAIIWLILGYSTLFDPGLTRAVTYHIARLDTDENAQRESVFITAIAINFSFGLVGAIITFALGYPLLIHFLKISTSMRQDVEVCMPWLAAAVPLTLTTNVLYGALQARNKFAAFNIFSAASAALSQAAPAVVAIWHGPDLRWLIPSVVIARTIIMVPTILTVWKTLPLGVGGRFGLAFARPLFSYGGWISLSNIVNPILMTSDRLVIGGMMGAQSVTYYTIPYSLISRLLIIPGSVSSSLFPQLSKKRDAADKDLAMQAIMNMTVIMTFLTCCTCIALPLFMKLWIGQDLADKAVPIGNVLLVGIWASSLSYIPSGELQAKNRPDLPALCHLIELLPFLVIVWLGIREYGLVGAAFACTFRLCLDSILLYYFSGRLKVWFRISPYVCLLILSEACAPSHIYSLNTIKAILFVFGLIIWSVASAPDIRARALQILSIKRPKMVDT